MLLMKTSASVQDEKWAWVWVFIRISSVGNDVFFFLIYVVTPDHTDI